MVERTSGPCYLNNGQDRAVILTYDCIVVHPVGLEARWYLLAQKRTIAFPDIIAGNRDVHKLLFRGSNREAQSWPWKQPLGSCHSLGHPTQLEWATARLEALVHIADASPANMSLFASCTTV